MDSSAPLQGLESLDSLFWRAPGCDDAPLALNGTRLTVRRLGELWNEGLSADRLCEEWEHIPREAILAGLAMYLRNRDAFDAEAKQEVAFADELYRQTGRPATLSR